MLNYQRVTTKSAGVGGFVLRKWVDFSKNSEAVDQQFPQYVSMKEDTLPLKVMVLQHISYIYTYVYYIMIGPIGPCFLSRGECILVFLLPTGLSANANSKKLLPKARPWALRLSLYVIVRSSGSPFSLKTRCRFSDLSMVWSCLIPFGCFLMAGVPQIIQYWNLWWLRGSPL